LNVFHLPEQLTAQTVFGVLLLVQIIKHQRARLNNF